MFRELLEFTGIDSSRLHFSWVSASEGKKWVDVVDGVTEIVRQKGPFEKYRQMARQVELPELLEEEVEA